MHRKADLWPRSMLLGLAGGNVFYLMAQQYSRLHPDKYSLSMMVGLVAAAVWCGTSIGRITERGRRPFVLFAAMVVPVLYCAPFVESDVVLSLAMPLLLLYGSASVSAAPIAVGMAFIRRHADGRSRGSLALLALLASVLSIASIVLFSELPPEFGFQAAYWPPAAAFLPSVIAVASGARKSQKAGS